MTPVAAVSLNLICLPCPATASSVSPTLYLYIPCIPRLLCPFCSTFVLSPPLSCKVHSEAALPPASMSSGTMSFHFSSSRPCSISSIPFLLSFCCTVPQPRFNQSVSQSV